MGTRGVCPTPSPQGGGKKVFKIVQGLSKFFKLHKFLIAEKKFCDKIWDLFLEIRMTRT